MKSFIAELQKIGGELMTVVKYLESWLGPTTEEKTKKMMLDYGHGKQGFDFNGPSQPFKNADTRIGKISINNYINGDFAGSSTQNLSGNVYSSAQAVASGNR